MRVLWFTNTPSNYTDINGGYNGGGWISSLESEISKLDNIDLAISFVLNGEPFKVKQGGVTYYPIHGNNVGTIGKIKSLFMQGWIRQNEDMVAEYLEVVSDFQPDIIQVFGSEEAFGLISKYTSIPVVLHIQGILNPYLNAFLPPFISLSHYYWSCANLKTCFRNRYIYCQWKRASFRELQILRNIKYFVGRTAWDERVTKVINPSCSYHYCSEILREVFYGDAARKIPENLVIVSTISSPLYKGYDLILKTAHILKHTMGVGFCWKIFGNVDSRLIEKDTGICSADVNVELKGVAKAEEIKQAILTCTAFVHPSYIDNSPNSVCEAQILGCPVVATNVGGIPSLIDDGKTGFLVPANDPYQMAYLIAELHKNKILNKTMGDAAREIATLRHDKKRIVGDLLLVYKNILCSK